jgi:hypothetical protein
MIVFNFIITFFRVILQQIIILFEKDSFYFLLIKFVISAILSIILYYLYYYYKYDYKFSKKYAIKTKLELLVSIIIFVLYCSIFILGFLFIRFYNVEKTLDLYQSINVLLNIIINTSYYNVCLTFYLILFIILTMKYIHTLLLKYITFHKNKLYYFTFMKDDSFETIFWFISRNLTIDNLIYVFINRNIAYVCYLLGLIPINNTNKNKTIIISFSHQIYDKLPRFVSLFTMFLTAKSFRLHYYVLFFVFFYDIFYNFYILENVYKVMPYIFIYEIIVRMSKTILVKNRNYDDFLAYYLYGTCFENNEDIITFGNRTWTQEEAYDIVADYAFNDFKDKEMTQLVLTPPKYDPFKFYNTSYFQISENIYKVFKKNYIIIIIFIIALILYS